MIRTLLSTIQQKWQDLDDSRDDEYSNSQSPNSFLDFGPPMANLADFSHKTRLDSDGVVVHNISVTPRGHSASTEDPSNHGSSSSFYKNEDNNDPSSSSTQDQYNEDEYQEETKEQWYQSSKNNSTILNEDDEQFQNEDDDDYENGDLEEDEEGEEEEFAPFQEEEEKVTTRDDKFFRTSRLMANTALTNFSQDILEQILYSINSAAEKREDDNEDDENDSETPQRLLNEKGRYSGNTDHDENDPESLIDIELGDKKYDSYSPNSQIKLPAKEVRIFKALNSLSEEKQQMYGIQKRFKHAFYEMRDADIAFLSENMVLHMKARDTLYIPLQLINDLFVMNLEDFQKDDSVKRAIAKEAVFSFKRTISDLKFSESPSLLQFPNKTASQTSIQSFSLSDCMDIATFSSGHTKENLFKNIESVWVLLFQALGGYCNFQESFEISTSLYPSRWIMCTPEKRANKFDYKDCDYLFTCPIKTLFMPEKYKDSKDSKKTNDNNNIVRSLAWAYYVTGRPRSYFEQQIVQVPSCPDFCFWKRSLATTIIIQTLAESASVVPTEIEEIAIQALDNCDYSHFKLPKQCLTKLLDFIEPLLSFCPFGQIVFYIRRFNQSQWSTIEELTSLHKHEIIVHLFTEMDVRIKREPPPQEAIHDYDGKEKAVAYYDTTTHLRTTASTVSNNSEYMTTTTTNVSPGIVTTNNASFEMPLNLTEEGGPTHPLDAVLNVVSGITKNAQKFPKKD